MIRAGVIGCGRIAQVRHAPEYAENPDCELAGFCDVMPERAQAMAAQYGVRAYTGIDEMLTDPSVDAVSICTANGTHAELSIRALEAGKHVLCEKPMAATAAEAEAMVEAAKRSGRLLMIGHNQRLAPANQLAKEILATGRLGRVLSFQTAFSHGGPEAWLKTDDPAKIWFFNNKQAAFGVLGDLGIHKADLLCWLLDDEVDEVRAFTATLDKRMGDGTPVSVEDNAALILRFRGGAVGTMLSSWTSYGTEDNSTVLNCEKGVIQIYRGDTQLRVIEADGKTVDYNPGAIQTNDHQSKSGIIDLFIAGIQAGRSPIPGEDGLRALRIIEKALAGQ